MTNPHRVLIVEDDADTRLVLADMLWEEGYATTLATNGAEAIDWLEYATRPFAVLVDLHMPGIVGQELLEYLRSEVRLAAIPVAIVTGSPELAPPGYTVFPKPLHVRKLMEFLARSTAPPV